MSKGFRQAKSEAESLLRIVTIGSSPCVLADETKRTVSIVKKRSDTSSVSPRSDSVPSRGSLRNGNLFIFSQCFLFSWNNKNESMRTVPNDSPMTH